jgi:hypothetical protein
MPSPSRAPGYALSAGPVFFGLIPGSTPCCRPGAATRKIPCDLQRSNIVGATIPGQTNLAGGVACPVYPSITTALVAGLLPPRHHLHLIPGAQLADPRVQGASRNGSRPTLRPAALLPTPARIRWPGWAEWHGLTRSVSPVRAANPFYPAVSPPAGGWPPAVGQPAGDLDSPGKSGYDENADMVRDAPYRNCDESRETGE